MKNTYQHLMIAVASALLIGCASFEFPSMFDKGSKEVPRYGKEAVHYQCDNYQSFGLKLSANGDEAWVMLPDHEIGLARDASDKQLYHYGTMDLRLNGEQTTLDDSDHLHLKNCKPVETKK
ncbi:hypothetical protein [Methylophilus sp. 14]|uniref:hypothetical protein n=1 Tax=Methylophilus sp. 14 TaxID=2781019 RepID=UPI00189083B7|nr:hypothetical protein [Methylophilus sp. 14]MBF4988931.1 hypothetical protein [Methylophilus sp. 14]